MSRRRGESLATRVAATQERGQAVRPAARQPEDLPTIRHCWYDGPHGRQAALLLEWRRVSGGWSGRIAVAAPDAAGWALVEMWVDAGLLAPTTATPIGGVIGRSRDQGPGATPQWRA